MKLKTGDIIEVHGYVMLNKMPEGKYKVAKINNNVYYFSKAKGKKIIIGHFTHNVDLWISDSDLNKITVVPSKS